MSGIDQEIRDSLNARIRRIAPQMGLICTVDSVDVSNNTCYCIPVNETADIPGVKLMAQNEVGVLIVPKVGSTVIVEFLENGTGYVSMYGKVQLVKLNGDLFGGLIQIDAQTAKLNLLVSQLQAQLALIATGIAGAGGAYTPGLLSTFNKTDYENTTVSHGNGT